MIKRYGITTDKSLLYYDPVTQGQGRYSCFQSSIEIFGDKPATCNAVCSMGAYIHFVYPSHGNQRCLCLGLELSLAPWRRARTIGSGVVPTAPWRRPSARIITTASTSAITTIPT